MIDLSGVPVEGEEKDKLVNLLKKKYVGEIETKGHVMWNLFIEKPSLFTFDKAKLFDLPNNHDLYFYLERQKTLHKTSYDQIILFIESLEPWEDVDGYVFDDSLAWVVAITHEDNKVLTLGL